MEETETTIYCDATGREIEDGFETLTMVLRRSGGAFGTSERTVHLSDDAHEFSYENLVEYDYVGYVSGTSDVVMVEESGSTRVTYHGRDTDRSDVRALIETLNAAVVND